MAYRPSRRLIISTSIILFLIGAFILVLPEVVRRVAVNRLGSFFTVPVSIGDIDVNLFTGHAGIENLVIGSNQPRPMMTLPAVKIEFSRRALLRGEIDFADIVLQNPELLIERIGPSAYNIVNAIRRSNETPQDNRNGGIAFSIDRLEIQNGEVIFIDHTQEPDYKLTLSSLNFAAGPIWTLPQAGDEPTTFEARLRVGDGSMSVTGSTKQFREPTTVEIKADISNVGLETFHVYLPYGERLNLKNSIMNGQARYVVAATGGKTSEHYLDADLKIGGTALMVAQASQPIVRISALAARDIHVNFLENTALVGALAIEEPYLFVARDSVGFNFQQLLPNETPLVEGRSGSGASANPMSLTIKRIEAENGAIEFVDQTVLPNVNSLFQDLRVTANDMNVLPTFAAAQIEGEARLDNGSLRVTGGFKDQSAAGQFIIAGESLPFEPFRGYLDQLFGSARSSGEQISGKLRLALIPETNREARIELSGNLEGQEMALRFPDQQNPFLTTQRLGVDLRTIRFGSNPRVDIDEIQFTGANLSVVRNKDGRLNLTRLWAADEKQNSEPAEKENKNVNETETIVAIRLISVDKSNIDIVDRSVSPNYDTKLSRVSGRLTDLRPKARRAELKLQGLLGDSAKLSLNGWFTPYSKETNMEFEGTVRSYGLPPLNPYATEYVSHRIQRGQITMDVKYTMTEGKVKAVADVVLRQVRVGERTGDEFIRRVGIPLELAVALLEDINGVIDLQFAITGERGFTLNIASLIWEAVRNSVVSAITAPFRLIGNILTFGGRIGGVRIEPIRFEPGTREVQAKSEEQLGKLTELLRQKPKLDLRLIGAASRSEIDAIKQKQFWEMLDSTEAKDYQNALVELYHKMGGVTKPVAPLDPIAEESLERFVLERIEISEAELLELAQDRAESVKQQLVSRGLDPERLSATARENIANDTDPAVEIELVS
jgi:uncharacterized protein involved in outer membrane biogenesis